MQKTRPTKVLDMTLRIIFSLSVAVFIALSELLARTNIQLFNNFFIFLGKNSFHIMAIHLSFFLILNIFLAIIIPAYRISDISGIYFRYPHIIWVYFSFSTTCSYLTIKSFQSHLNINNFSNISIIKKIIGI